MDTPRRDVWPELRLEAWEPTYLTLHRWLQIVGKVRMAHAAWLNHWWHTALYVTPEGLTTSAMPCGERHLSLTFDFCTHHLVGRDSDGRVERLALEPMSVATFYRRLMDLLEAIEAPTRIWPVPVEVVDTTPFPQDTDHAAYDRDAVERMHCILRSCARVFEIHRGRFLGKSSPVHLFWGAFDLAVTRFSGRTNPDAPPDPVMGEAYSHEVVSHGFWPGGDWPGSKRVDEAIFYAYSVPAPEGFGSAAVEPAAAYYDGELGEFVLPYEAVRTAADPEATLLAFMESTWRAAAHAGGWDLEALTR